MCRVSHHIEQVFINRLGDTPYFQFGDKKYCRITLSDDLACKSFDKITKRHQIRPEKVEKSTQITHSLLTCHDMSVDLTIDHNKKQSNIEIPRLK